MSTVSFNNTSGNGNQKQWTRASIAAAVAAGAITTEAANILYQQLKPEPEPEPVPDPTPEPEPIPEPDPTPTPEPEPEPVPTPEPTPNPTPYQTIEPEPTPQPEPTPIPDPTPEPIPEPEPYPDPYPDFPEPNPEPSPAPGERDDVVEVIVTEIDPLDIDMEDIFFVEDIGVIYTEYGEELNVAVISDGLGGTAMFVDVDGDQVYDVLATEDGDVIAQLPLDMDVSDMELLYAQQHGYNGYIEPNDFDVAMNEENSDIQSDISLS